MSLDKLKEAARRHELREEWRKAIDTYHRAVAELADAGEPVDPSLYNRIGDLELKAGDPGGALQAYEHAIESYADQGFFNNAIALCGKILRVDPARTVTYLRLAELHARKNVAGEVRRNLTQYIGHMGAAAQQSALAEALRKFAERFALSIEQRNLLAEVLRDAPRTQTARETLDQLAGELGLGEGRASEDSLAEVDRPGGGFGGLVFIDTGILPVAGRMVPPGDQDFASPSADADLTRGLAFEAELAPTPATLDFIEPTSLSLPATAIRQVSPLEGFEPTRVDEEAAVVPAGLPPLALEGLAPEPVEILGLDTVAEFTPLELLDAPVADPLAGAGDGVPAPLPLIPLATDALFDELDVEEEALAETVADHAGVDGASDGELEGTIAQAVAEERWELALRALAELLRRAPDAIPRHQKRVEIAYRSGDRLQLIGAYLSLAQALERAGALENARLVYERVLEHDAANPVAAAAVSAMGAVVETHHGPAPTPVLASGNDYVDLGALILEPEPERDTRMRVDQGEPEREEDVDFRETLEQFKQGIAANLDADDFQAHYDLGIAFKEMGLLDEAIAQFQKALRAPGGKLKSSEALGIAFFDKGRHAIAETVLSRAIDTLPGADDEKIGLIYWLGRTSEVQGRVADALRCYERALAVDITFLDLSERVHRLTAERLS
jgi:tetratricopeptide (TPR) repeat protein